LPVRDPSSTDLIGLSDTCRSCGHRGASLTQSNLLQWLAALDVIGKRPTDLSHRPPLIL
jgi:hypothetical protein